MSDTSQPFSNDNPSPSSGEAEKDGYSARFYPGFVRRLRVRGVDGVEVELYKQSETFFLPSGTEKPDSTSRLEFVRPDGRRIVLQVEDDDQQIARIEVHFKGAGGYVVPLPPETEGLAPLDGDPPPPLPPGEVLICEDGVVLCPPICPGPGTGK